MRKHPRLGPFPHSVRTSGAIGVALVRAAWWMTAQSLDHVQERRAEWAEGTQSDETRRERLERGQTILGIPIPWDLISHEMHSCVQKGEPSGSKILHQIPFLKISFFDHHLH